ncbi:hypothetical protein LIER_39588 [Lithospermum erythrorhizon]|uniref:RNase H type-1 domain-containing protein n=1 Tax=Lithospermum erythrorhizon TaxID=34254 RepID=A0AAV3QLH2_LITER
MMGLKLKTGTIGVVGRDNQGNFLAAKFRHLPCISSALVAEALACREDIHHFSRSLEVKFQFVRHSSNNVAHCITH